MPWNGRVKSGDDCERLQGKNNCLRAVRRPACIGRKSIAERVGCQSDEVLYLSGPALAQDLRERVDGVECTIPPSSVRLHQNRADNHRAREVQSLWQNPDAFDLAKRLMKRQNPRTMSHKHNHPPHNPGLAKNGAPAPETGHGFPSEHRRGLLPEKYFRWRSGEITRLEAFCDVVFGFALTLLVVSLEVPHNYTELMAAMRGFVPFAVCFAQLVMIWRAHYIFSRRYGLEDGYTVLLNVTLLFVVLFYVYPLKFVFTMLFLEVTGTALPGALDMAQASVVMRIYAAGFASVFLLFLLMYAHAYRLRHALELSPVEALETRNAMQENALLVLIGATSFFVAFRSPGLSGWTYALIGPAMTIHGTIFGKKVRLLAEKG